MHASSRIHAHQGIRPSAAPHRHSTPAHDVHHETSDRRHVRGNDRHSGGAARPVACRIVQAHRPYYL